MLHYNLLKLPTPASDAIGLFPMKASLHMELGQHKKAADGFERLIEAQQRETQQEKTPEATPQKSMETSSSKGPPSQALTCLKQFLLPQTSSLGDTDKRSLG